MAAIDQDTFFSDLFQTGMSDPKSKAYLPGMIMQTTNPSLNPYTMASLDLGKQKLMGVDLNVSLSKLSIGGIPNISVSPAQKGKFQLDDLTINFTAQFGQLNPPPVGSDKQLTFASGFELSFTGNKLDGKLSVLISAAELDGVIDISGGQLETIVTTIKSVTAVVPSSAIVTPTVTFTNPDGKFFEQAMQDFLKKPSTVTMITKQVNKQIQSTSVMKSLSKELTSILQKAIKKQLN